MFLEINNQKVHYLEKNSEAQQTIIFLHGNSHSSLSYLNQLNNSSLSAYRLIFIDLPGHGESDKLASYSLINIANVLVEFIDSLTITNFLIVGHSLGGHVALHMLEKLAPQGLLIFGTPPLSKPFYPESFLANTNALPLSMAESSEEQLSLLAEELKYNQQDTTQFIIDYQKSDANFRTQIFNSVANNLYLDEVDLLKNFGGYFLSLICMDDKIINSDYTQNIIPENSRFEFLQIASGHSPQIEVPEIFNATLLEFSNKIFFNHGIKIDTLKVTRETSVV